MSASLRVRALLLALAACLLVASPAATGATGGYEQTDLAYATGTETSPLQVWAAGPSGAPPELLGAGLEPLLSPTGKLVAASLSDSNSGPALAVYSVAGAPARTYASLTSVTAQPLAFSPDSKYLAVSLISTAIKNMGKRSSLAVIDLETGAMRTIAHGIPEGASFAPEGSDMLAYGLASSYQLTAPVDIHVSAPDGSGARLFTHDGRSLNPVWGSSGIAYDRERLRHLEAPVYQIWLASPSGGGARQLTHLKINPLVEGLVPLAFSADGSNLLAEFEGEDTSAAWTVDLTSGRVRELTTPGRHTLEGAGISQDGTTVLVDEDSLQSPPSSGRIVLIPFDGGSAHVLVAHAGEASWNE
jgi:Tol biopolymer transport system component